MGQGLRTSLAGWFCFQSLICHLQSSEGLSGTRGSTSRLSHSHVCRLVVVVRRNPQFLPMGASPQAAWVSSPCDDWLPPELEQSESVPVPYDLASESHTIVLAHLIGCTGHPYFIWEVTAWRQKSSGLILETGFHTHTFLKRESD